MVFQAVQSARNRAVGRVLFSGLLRDPGADPQPLPSCRESSTMTPHLARRRNPWRKTNRKSVLERTCRCGGAATLPQVHGAPRGSARINHDGSRGPEFEWGLEWTRIGHARPGSRATIEIRASYLRLLNEEACARAASSSPTARQRISSRGDILRFTSAVVTPYRGEQHRVHAVGFRRGRAAGAPCWSCRTGTPGSINMCPSAGH